MIRRALACFLLVCAVDLAPAIGQETQPPAPDVPGHSYHGEAFNEGPRQAAYLMGGTGQVSFPVTTKKPAAQGFIEQGVGQLHGFWYFEAERSFRQAAAIDGECAMAYWGMAMANANNEGRAKGFIAEAVRLQEPVTPREKRYIEMLDAFLKADPKKNKERHEAYTKALERLLYEFPDDVEAKAFLAVQIWKNRSAEIPINSYLAADALLDQIFAVAPMHPAHHYRIHLWDDERAEKALSSAALGGQAAPAIAHMWHMPGHTFARLKRYEDSAWQQEASARVDHAHMMRDRVMPDQIHNFAHNNEWLIRNLIHVGRVRDAIELAKNMIELPRHPKYNTLDTGGSARYGRERLFDVLTEFELWQELVALCNSPYLSEAGNDGEQVKRLRLLGAAHLRLGDSAAAAPLLANLRERLTAKKAAQEKAIADAEAKAKSENRDEKQIEQAKNDAKNSLAGEIESLEKGVSELEGLEALLAGDASAAFDKLKQAGVGPLALAHVQLQAGKKDEALTAVRKRVESHEKEVLPLAHLVEVAWKAEAKDEAKSAFERLREISNVIDITAPAFARLAPIAAELGLPEDWRIHKPPASDVGERPSLEMLGPFRWRPAPAPSWSLLDVNGQGHSSADFAGKPHVLIFYLGYGCLHCAEQLQAFAPLAGEYSQAGVELVAISTDDAQGLKRSIDDYQPNQFPFPLVGDSELTAFKAFRAYDDFERQPLHATVLIDGAGQIRWQDIGHEPFRDAKFLLDEAKRLLAIPETPSPFPAAHLPAVPLPATTSAAVESASQRPAADSSTATN